MKTRFERSVEWMIVVLFASFCLVMLAQVVSRSLFNSSILWSEEFTRYSFIWMILLASGIAIKRKAHMGFDLIIIKFSNRVRYGFHILNDCLVGAFLVLLFFKGFDLLKSAGMTPSPSMHIPMGMVYVILPLSALVMFIFLLESLWNNVKNFQGGDGNILYTTTPNNNTANEKELTAQKGEISC